MLGKVADVRSNTEVADLFTLIDREMGGLDILVNNAGVGVFKSTADLSVEDWQKTLETNLSGVFYCCREALPRLKQRGGGYIINISSLAGKNAFAGGAAYNASKFGLNGFSEAMMLDHRYDKVRVSYVMPGSVDTEFGSGTGPSGLEDRSRRYRGDRTHAFENAGKDASEPGGGQTVKAFEMRL